MLHALSAPFFKSVLIGGALLGVGIGATAIKPERTTKRLVLHAPVEANAIYLSAWDEGDVQLNIKGALRPMTFEIRASINDGCRWLGVETLIPIDEKTFAYDYDEYILECEPGAEPYRKTPRKGVVTVED